MTQRPTMTVATAAVLPLLLAMLVSVAAANPPARHFSHPERIRYDGQCLTIEGQDVFLFSGAFHYFRTPKELWRARFAKIKEAGFNAVETYVPWNWHERQLPKDLNDVSQIDLTDLRDWMTIAHDEFGLYTIIRPGPYICAEWVGGGFPQWLWSRQPKGFDGKPWIRSDDPTYLAWAEHWMNAVWPVVASEQITRKPKGNKGVILVQIENEYDLFDGVSEDARVRHMRTLYDGAVRGGIDVPIFTCVTRQTRGSADPDLSQVFDTANFYHRWNLRHTAKGVRDLLAAQRNAPAMVAELQGGWFDEAGRPFAEDQDSLDAAQCNAITLTAVANGATMLNYYMLVGGSNFGSWGSNSMLQTYDYNAPIREAGGVTEKYAAVKAIGTFLTEYGSTLARSEPVDAKVSTPGVNVEIQVRRDPTGRLYVFCRNPDRTEQTVGFEIELDGGRRLALDHRFPPRVMTVLVLPPDKARDSEGQWTCEPDLAPRRPPVPQPVRVTTAWTRDETGPTQWGSITPGQSLIQAGVYDAGDVVYRARPSLTKEQVEAYVAACVGNDSTSAVMVMRVNGKFVAARKVGRTTEFPIVGLLREGDNTIELLYQNHGVANFGDAMNVQPGVTSMSLLTQGTLGKPVTDWNVTIVEDKPQRPEVAADFDDAKWDRVVLDAKRFAELAAHKQPGAPALTYPAMTLLDDKHATAVYRATVELSEKDIANRATRLEIGSIDEQGEVFVNGKSVGTSRSFREPFVADVNSVVRAGRNTIAVKVTNRSGDGGITKPVIVYTERDALPIPLELGTGMAGVVGRWWNVAGLTGWTEVPLDVAQPLPIKGGPAIKPPAPNSLHKWIRAEFETPPEQPGVWVPWGAVIHASGNGFVYLNGHELGRYYDAGLQRRFYLPQPWLKTGPGEKNVLTLSLNAAEGEPGLLGLELTPISDQAEAR